MKSQDAATRILKQASSRHTTNADRIYTKELFVKEFEGIFSADTKLSETDFDILYTYLSRDRGAIVYDGRVCIFFIVSLSSTRVIANVHIDYQIQRRQGPQHLNHPRG